MEGPLRSNLIDASSKYPKPVHFNPSYGTAGFRAKGTDMASTVFRCGLLMALRSMQTSQRTGICITASHNPDQDNGVKLVEPTGDMLSQDWEGIADELANAATDDELVAAVQKLVAEQGIAISSDGGVIVAHDTRTTSPSLAAAAVAGVQCLGVHAEMLGLLTTPQLHWIVMEENKGLPHAEEDYYNMLVNAYTAVVTGSERPSKTLYIDCANGVGGPKLSKFARRFEAAGLHMKLLNTGAGVLNGDCGSDFVQKEKRLPTEFDQVPAGASCCSIDGDADRLLFFSPCADGTIKLYDGDKIAVLMAIFCKELIKELPGSLKESSVGIVQTAYANGNSTQFITETLGCEVKITPTGVKHLHAAAHSFDIGIYFEANGHGTVLFKNSFIEELKKVSDSSSAASDLLALCNIINQAVGDALSGIFMVEAVLNRKGWGLEDWGKLYTDLPSVQLKVKVADRRVIKTNENETKALAPAGLQDAIDAQVAGVPSGRSFVRPSGTEDVVRVYAEAATQEAADALGAAVAKVVHELAGGLA